MFLPHSQHPQPCPGPEEHRRGWQRAAHPKWADEMGMEIHTKLQGSKMDWREH